MNPHRIWLLRLPQRILRSLMGPQCLQMLQHGQIRIHKPFNTVCHTRLFLAGQLAGCYRAGDAFLETGLGQIVDSCRFRVRFEL
jgi:hypothetical protein